MLTAKEIEEIRNYLNRSENPLFLYDDDPDGLCSYVLLKKYIDRGKGIIIKGAPLLEEKWVKKVEEYSPDLVVILDKPIVSQEFIDKINVPILWIDHHPIIKRKGIHHYNPRYHDENDNSPTTFLAYQIVKQNLWIAMIGCIADWYVPDFADEFSKKYKDLLNKVTTPEDTLFNTGIGRLVRIVSFILKGKNMEVNKNISIFSRIESPYEILKEETPKGKFISKYSNKINKIYHSLLEKSLKEATEDKILLFIYPDSKISFTSDLANELLYRYPKKLIIIGRETNEEVKLSLRSTNIKLPPLIEKALKEVKGYGGGHDFACGANIAKNDFKTFIDNLKNLL